MPNQPIPHNAPLLQGQNTAVLHQNMLPKMQRAPIPHHLSSFMGPMATGQAPSSSFKQGEWVHLLNLVILEPILGHICSCMI